MHAIILIPPRNGERDERSEPGGARANLGTREEHPTRPAFASLRRVTLPFQGKDSRSGFTLVEVIAALAILALCLSVLLGTISDALWHTSEAQAQAEAGSMARSLLAQAGGTVPLREGETAGRFDNGFRWRLRTENYVDGANAQASPVRAYKVTAEVLWDDARQERSAALVTLRLGAAEDAR